jgi:hypothetical protein
MIIVKNEDTLEQAVELLQKLDVVRYSDCYSYRKVSQPDSLKTLCTEALKRNEIALVAAVDEELPVYQRVWADVRVQIREERKRHDKEIRAWVRTHKAEVQTMMRSMK